MTRETRAAQQAPTVDEIRAVLAAEWHRRRTADMDSLCPRSDSLSDQLREHLTSDLQSAATDLLWQYDGSPAPNAAGLRRDRLVDEVLEPIFQRVEQELVEALATALGRWSDEHPNAPRAEDRDLRWAPVEPQLTEA